jgi:DNA (cytosine-5)-methyltransferase 1
MPKKRLRVIELFAGVGGFRLGLEKNNSKRSKYFDFVWANQWEPSTKTQTAYEIYAKRFGSSNGYSNIDIAEVPIKKIPDHDLLVGGFPCQDYSVARTLNQATGIIGKKGVLWWQIHRIINEKGKKRPSFLMLENVDRLLKSPSKQRGRDFAIMLASLSDLGYIVEWRVINAADYGMPQRRRRVFIMGYHKKTDLYRKIKKIKKPVEWIIRDGIMFKAFPIKVTTLPLEFDFSIDGDLVDISERFESVGSKSSPFENAGIMIGRRVITVKGESVYDGERSRLRDLLLDEKAVPAEYFIDENDLKKWKYLKGSKTEERVSKTGHVYNYSEGSMVFPDDIDKPSRTIITAEGGPSPSRFKHVIREKSGRLRRLTPVELERLNMFPDGHTEGASDKQRAFFMGNALVVGIVERLGKELLKRI